MFEDLDELASALAEDDISRHQAIRWAGYSVAGAALSSLGLAESAEALRVSPLLLAFPVRQNVRPTTSAIGRALPAGTGC